MHHLPTGTVTLLFADLEGSTHLLQQIRERYPEVLTEYRSFLHQTLQDYGGAIVETQGNTCLVAFAYATKAVKAGVAAQRALASHCWPEDVVLRARIGLHTGESELACENYMGQDVHQAACIMRAGHGGQILLSETTCALVAQSLPAEVNLRDLGHYRLEDFPQPAHLFQVVVAGLPGDFPPLRALNSRIHTLPVQPTPLVGREQEVARVCELLCRDEVHLVTLIGSGGIGKTRLGLQVAMELRDDFADGVFFVNLAPLSESTLVIPTIAQTLAIREVAGQSPLERLKDMFWQKQVLLLLDNFEQVISAANEIVNLLTVCPKLKVLVTSRAMLHVRAEHVFPVPPLAVPDPHCLHHLAALAQYEAVALFIKRAQAIQPDFQFTNMNGKTVVEICARLDGLPLAIELAAARIRLLHPQALLQRLVHPLQVLTSGARDVPTRQQTLRNTITWSYHLLDEQEQRLFQQLSVFVGGCTLEAIEVTSRALGGDKSVGEVLDGVTSLIDKSLLQQTEPDGEESRLTMLETIREYGRECLLASGQARVAQCAHAAYYLALAEAGEPRLTGVGKREWLKRLQREHQNLRTALVWLLENGEREAALRLCSALWRFWWMGGHLSEGRNMLGQILAGSEEEVAMPVRAKALNAAGALAGRQADFKQAEVLCEKSLTLFQHLGDVQGMATSLGMLGYAALEQSHYAVACARGEEAVALFKEVGDQDGIIQSLLNLALAQLFRGEYAQARSLSEEALELSREGGDSWSLAISLGQLGLVHLFQGELARARSLLEESLALSRQEAYKPGMAFAFKALGQVILLQGDLEMARSLLQESLILCRALGDQLRIAQVLISLAWACLVKGDDTMARTHIEESLALAKTSGCKWSIAFCLATFCVIEAKHGEATSAAYLGGAVEALHEAIGAKLPSVIRAVYEETIATVQAQLGEKAFAAAWAKGRTLSAEQTLGIPGPVKGLWPIPEGQPQIPSAKPQLTYPAGLTAREMEVLRLVASGLTDAQVAHQLVISPHTVNAHLKAIYGKIAVSSRSAATRYALEHQLA